MSELATNRTWDLGVGAADCPSQYARMILGASVSPRVVTTSSRSIPPTTACHPVDEADRDKRPSFLRAPRRRPSPRSAIDRFTLYQIIAADSMAVTGACIALSAVFPGLGLPWRSLPIFAVLTMLFGFCEGTYERAGDPFPRGITLKLTRSTLSAIGLVTIAAWGGIRLLAACTTLAASLGSLMLCRELRQIAWNRRSNHREPRKVLIVGGGPVARSVAQGLRNDPSQGTTVCGFVDDDQPLSPAILGRISDLEWLARAEFIDEVILALPGQPTKAKEAAALAFRNHLDIRAVPDLPLGPWRDLALERIGEVPVVTLHREQLPTATLFIKRLLDISGSALGLVIVSPLLAAVALLIHLDSPGPVLYLAERTGAKGRRFQCYKFRSMVRDAERLKENLRARNEREGPIFKMEDDPRVTRVGRIIRRYSLDELPQLWNVLRGEMSLVGPRPHPVEEVNHYELQHYRRLDVKPGLTGLWQITARDCPSFELNMHLDLTYIENWSLRLDLSILVSTVRVLFAPEGA